MTRLKLLVMSDTHGDNAIIRQVVAANPEVDAIFHCGDSELPANDQALKGIHVVQGNCDLEGTFPEEKTVDVEGTRIYITHGHLFRVKSTLMPLKYRAEEVGADLVLFGHSHLLGTEKDGDVLFLNPGSLKLPRGRHEKSYSIIRKETGKWRVSFYSDNHILLEETIL